jgi:hypothetical protein
VSDHEVIRLMLVYGGAFVFANAMWKIFGTQRRLNKLERKVEELERKRP